MPRLRSEIAITPREVSFAYEPAVQNTVVGESILSGENVKRWLFAIYLLFVEICSFRAGLIHARSNEPYIIGDWLINYSGGFVRRGLIGTLVMMLHRLSGESLNGVVFSMQVVVFLLFLLGVYRLTKGMNWSYWMVAVLLSPATLAFTVLDPEHAGLRKEILLFAALALVIWVLISDRLRDWQITIMLSVLLVGLTLSHEALLIAAPYLFAAVAIQTMSLRRAIRICAIPFALTGIAVVAVLVLHGNLATAQAVCRSVGGQMAATGSVNGDGGICSGAIGSLQLTVSEEHAGIIEWIRAAHLPAVYGFFAILTFAPLIVLMTKFYRRDGLRFEVVTVLGCAVVSLTGMFILMYAGSDWGRWIHIQAMSLMLLAMMLARKAVFEYPKATPPGPYPSAIRTVAILGLLLYLTIWTLPATGAGLKNQGYLSLTSPKYRAGLLTLRAAAVSEIKKIG